jgi:NAD(P)-dependent dehydrogenase (short-subunit alcohol dehydrogenase family)
MEKRRFIVTGNFRLDGRTAVITGAGSGIGQAIARTFAKNGASVIALDLQRERAEETVRQIGGTAQTLVCDVTDPESTAREFGNLASRGRIDILVNSAGISHIGKLETTSPDEFDRVFRVNVKGVFLCMQAVIEPMKRSGGGVILNMASIAATSGLSDRFAYSMSKGAVLSMTLSVARDYLPHNIRCNAISPARIHTPFVDAFLKQHYPGNEPAMFAKLSQAQPVGRMGSPEEVASLALYLCSDESSFLTGADIPLDGGFVNLRG